MSYTVTIQGPNLIDGSTALSALANTSASYHDPESEINPGFISVDGRTSVGVVFLPKDASAIDTVRGRLRASYAVDGSKIMVRSVDMGPHTAGVVNLLIPKPDFHELSGVFRGVKSKWWLLENTGWWEEYVENVSVTPPGIIYPEGKSPAVILRVGAVTRYFDEKWKHDHITEEMYGTDTRGYEFRKAHHDLHVSKVGDLLFEESIEKHGYVEGLRRLTKDSATGLLHQYTVVYYDELQNFLTCAHLAHENYHGSYKKFTGIDMNGNRLTITNDHTRDRFQVNWPHAINGSWKEINGAMFTSIEGGRRGIERER